MEMLKEFNEDIAGEVTRKTEIPEEDIDGLTDEEKLLLGELNEVSDEEVIFNKLSKKETEEIEKRMEIEIERE